MRVPALTPDPRPGGGHPDPWPLAPGRGGAVTGPCDLRLSLSLSAAERPSERRKPLVIIPTSSETWDSNPDRRQLCGSESRARSPSRPAAAALTFMESRARGHPGGVPTAGGSRGRPPAQRLHTAPWGALPSPGREGAGLFRNTSPALPRPSLLAGGSGGALRFPSRPGLCPSPRRPVLWPRGRHLFLLQSAPRPLLRSSPVPLSALVPGSKA